MSLPEKNEYVKVHDLKPYLGRVYLKGKIVELGTPREVSRGEHRVSDNLVGDESGCIYMTLWDDDINQFEVGNTVHVENGYVSVYRNSMRLTAGKRGTVTKIDEEITEVNADNNLSDQQVKQRQQRPYGNTGDRFGGGNQPNRYDRNNRKGKYWYQRRQQTASSA